MIEIDRKDRQILALLLEDGRISNADLAERVHLSPSACLRRVRNLEESGVIAGYVTRLDPVRMGRSLNVFVEVTLKSQSEEAQAAFEAAVAECPEVTECTLMSGEADYLLHLHAADMTDFERLHRQSLSALPGVARIQSSFGIRTVFQRPLPPLA